MIASGETMFAVWHARRRGERGFTFVEILVVVIILAVLALIAIATFLGQREKAERSRAVSALRNAETFAVAIRSDAERFSECVADYEAEAGQGSPYTWVADPNAAADGVGGSSDPAEISVYGPETTDPCDPVDDAGGWATLATLARDTCYYNLLVPGLRDRVRHRAEVDPTNPGAPTCEASELTWDAGALEPVFRGDPLPEPSGW